MSRRSSKNKPKKRLYECMWCGKKKKDAKGGMCKKCWYDYNFSNFGRGDI